MSEKTKYILFEEDWAKVVTFCVLGFILACYMASKDATTEKMKLIEKGYQQCQMIGSTSTVWQKECIFKQGEQK